MGSVTKVIKKVTKAVTKPVSKAFKSVAKGIMKVGKATLRGVAKLQAKLGPLGSIAMAIAMPYALSGLSTAIGTAGVPQLGIKASGMLGSENIFIRSIGQVGNAIRTGYNGAVAKVSTKLNSITNSISKGFSNFGKGNNIFSKISDGAKNLFNQSRQQFNKLKNITPKPFAGQQGTVDILSAVPGGGTAPMTLPSETVAGYLKAGTVDASQLSQQTFGKTGWFTRGSTVADQAVTDAINGAYKSKLDTFSPNARRYFDDLVTKADTLGMKTNYQEIGSLVEDSLGTTRSFAADYSTTPYKIDVDLSRTGDYTLGSARDRLEGVYNFTGDKSFANINDAKVVPSNLKTAIKKGAASYAKGLLTPSDTKLPVSYAMPNTSDMTFETQMSGYSGTDIAGSGGGTFIQDVFGENAARRMQTYYKNMNLLEDMGSY